MTKTYSISELAEEFDITTRTIRFYESEGLISPERVGQRRVYNDRDRVLIKLILRGKRIGFSLSESREIIGMYDPESGNLKQLDALRQKIQERRQALQHQLEDIKAMQLELDDAEKRINGAIDATLARPA